MDSQASSSMSNELLDALPYIDTAISEPGMMNLVTHLIQEEMHRMNDPDPLRTYLPQRYTTQKDFTLPTSELLEEALSRLENSLELDVIDTEKYTEKARVARTKAFVMAERNEKLFEMNAVLNEEKLVAETKNHSLINLEILNKYGPKAWTLSNHELSIELNHQRNMMNKLESQVTEINKRRKLNQITVGEQLRRCEDEYVDLIRRNQQITSVIQQMK